MTEKIEWYKEVLTLEPNSKIFFPLARMLEREGDLEQACEVHGISADKLVELINQYEAGKTAPAAE